MSPGCTKAKDDSGCYIQLTFNLYTVDGLKYFLLVIYFLLVCISQVVRALDSIVEESDLSNGMNVGQSQVYDSAEQSAQIRMFQKLAFGSQIFSSEYSRQL